MYSLNLMTEADRKEAAKIERKRAIEEERKKRIFNPRQRLIGIDYEGLQHQIEEKKRIEAQKHHVEEVFEDQMQKYDRLALALEAKEREERRRLQQEINDYRLNCQKFEDRREFDLNDPAAMKKSLPARLGDDDPGLGISSVQKFEGEDLTSEKRAKIQREQIQSWLQQQMKERDAADKERKAAEEAFKTAVIARDQRAIQLDEMEKECRRKLDQANSNFNKALAEERKRLKVQKERQEEEDRLAQFYNTMTSDMMTENPDVSISSLGQDRRIGYLYKGMSEAEKQEFRRAQLQQIEDNKKKKAEEDRREQEWTAYMSGNQKMVAQISKEMNREQKKLEKQLQEENLQLGVEQKKQREFMERIVYANKPTAEFYAQFNTSSR